MARDRIAPGLVAAALAGLWLAFAPATADLAAQVYRTALFEQEGFTVFNAQWYGGHHTPGYSILYPPLASALAPRLVGALAAIVSAVLFERIARRHFGPQARWGALWFGVATATDLFIGRLTFGLGMALGLGAVLALQDGRRRLGLALGVACTLGSPVAGVFLALAGAARWIAERDRTGLWLAGAALAPVIALSLAFPEGGEQPFSLGALAVVVGACSVLAIVVPPEERVLRAGVALYVCGALASFVLATPMGANVTRLGATFAGPLLACVVLARLGSRGRGRLAVAVAAALPLAAWQWYAPVRETTRAAVDPSAAQAYFAPLIGFLDSRADAAVRVEVPFTRLHWEAVHVARRYPLARGWETQLDVKLNPLFRGDAARRLTPARYHAWLRREGVRYVALPDVALDPSGRDEARIIRRRPAFLRPVHRTRNWTVFEVAGTPGMSSGVGRVTHVGPESFTLRAREPGFALVRLRFTPYWRVAAGSACLSPGAHGWTLVYVSRPGAVTVRARFDPGRLWRRGTRCGHGPAGKVENNS